MAKASAVAYVLLEKNPLTIHVLGRAATTNPKAEALLPRSIVLQPGNGELAAADFDEVSKIEVITSMVEEGTLNFPGVEAFATKFNSRNADLIARNARMSAEREEARAARLDNPGVDELTRVVGDLTSQLNDERARNLANEERMARLEEMVKTQETGKAPAAPAAPATDTPPPPPSTDPNAKPTWQLPDGTAKE